MRLSKHKSRNRRRHAACRARTYGWSTFMRWFTGPESTQDAPDQQPTAQAPAPDYRPLPALPPGSMSQRGVGAGSALPPVTHTYAGGLCGTADLPEVSNRVMAALRPAFRLDPTVPLFRDDTTWEQFEKSRLERLHRMQQNLEDGWPDAHGVNLGHGQSPKTLIMSTVVCPRFSDNTGVLKPVSR